VFGVAGSTGASDPGFYWTTDGQNFTYNNTTNAIAKYHAVASDTAGARTVLVGRTAPGTAGVSAVSNNLTSWAPNSGAALTQPQYGVAYGAGLFVSVGDAASIYSSTDGLVWSARAPGTLTAASHFRDVKFLNGYFVAVSSIGDIAHSPDGITWTSTTAATHTGDITNLYSLVNVTFQNGKYYAFTSSAGMLVSPTTTPMGAWNKYFGHGLAGGGYAQVLTQGGKMYSYCPGNGNSSSVLLSADGKAFGAVGNRPAGVSSSDQLSTFSYQNSTFIGVLGGAGGGTAQRFIYSVDGINWSLVRAGASQMCDVFWTGTQWAVVVSSSTNYIYTSPTLGPDGTVLTSSNWTTRYTSGTLPMRVVYGNGLFVGVGGGGNTWVSPDGVTGLIGFPFSDTPTTNTVGYLKVK
jgi:hypothetical protein